MAYRPSEGRNQKKQTPPVQPNLVPIMNLFLTIIPFLLMMVVITQVAMVALNFSAAGGGGGGGEGSGGGNGPAKEIRIIIMASSGNMMYPGFEIREQGGETDQIKNSDNNGQYNFVALNQKLADLKKRNSTVNEITVVVYPDVVYGSLIQTIDLCKQNGFPSVIYKPSTTVVGTF